MTPGVLRIVCVDRVRIVRVGHTPAGIVLAGVEVTSVNKALNGRNAVVVVVAVLRVLALGVDLVVQQVVRAIDPRVEVLRGSRLGMRLGFEGQRRRIVGEGSILRTAGLGYIDAGQTSKLLADQWAELARPPSSVCTSPTLGILRIDHRNGTQFRGFTRY